MIEITKISSKGQVTIPIELRKYLNLPEGGKVAFVLDEKTGRVYIVNSSMLALKEVQTSFEGAAEELGISDESQVAAFLKNAR